MIVALLIIWILLSLLAANSARASGSVAGLITFAVLAGVEIVVLIGVLL